MVKCTVCYAWQPKEWDGSKAHWADTVAQCSLKNKFTTAGESCEDGRIIAPKVQTKDKTFVPERVKPKVYIKLPAGSAPWSPCEESNVITYGGALYAHQKEAFERFKDAKEIALFMEMGTGKSATILRIAGHKFKRGQIDALLVVAPNDVHVQWAREQIPQWLDCPYDIQCLYGRGGAKQAFPFEQNDEVLQVVVVNIDTFSTPSKWQDIPAWASEHKTMIVLDEATVIKNVSAKRTERLLYSFNDVVRKGKTIKSSTVKTVARAILTGTPVTNGPMDMWAMMEFLRPSYFGRNWYSFQAHFGMFTNMSINDRVIKVPLSEEMWHAIKACGSYLEANSFSGCSEDTFNTIHAQDHYEGPYKHADELRELIKPVSYFKLLRECIDMPEENRIQRALIMNDAMQECYDSMLVELMAEWEGHVATAQSKLTAMIRLQQICSGFLSEKGFKPEPEQLELIEKSDDPIARMFGLSDEDDILPNEITWIGTSNPKLEALYRDVDEIAKPLIIITRFTAEADRIFNDLSKQYRCCLMTGWKRVGTIEEFQHGQFDVMVANSAVVARGFNLQNSHTILFYSNTFSLEMRLQAEGRIFRIGQKYPCDYVDYLYQDTVDEKIVGALKRKRNLLDFIRNVDGKELLT